MDSLINMAQEWSIIEKFLFEANGLRILDATKDKECSDYFGYNFQLGDYKVKFRKAKLTPKKIGQFVALWKRNLVGKTIPFDINDDFDFYIVMVSKVPHLGFFIFPKKILAEIGILSADKQGGKRGFTIYPEWDIPVSKQGLSTKQMQIDYFIGLTDAKKSIQKLQRIFTLK